MGEVAWCAVGEISQIPGTARDGGPNLVDALLDMIEKKVKNRLVILRNQGLAPGEMGGGIDNEGVNQGDHPDINIWHRSDVPHQKERGKAR